MANEKINDQVRNKIIEAVTQIVEAKNNGTIHPLLIDAEIHAAMAKAETLYKTTNDRTALLIMGLTHAEIDKIKRKRGQPKKTLYDAHHIVQLVYKQNLQAGVSFSKLPKRGEETNECFIGVAEHQGVGVDQIVKKYKEATQKEREKIKRRLKLVLDKHNKLNNRK